MSLAKNKFSLGGTDMSYNLDYTKFDPKNPLSSYLACLGFSPVAEELVQDFNSVEALSKEIGKRHLRLIRNIHPDKNAADNGLTSSLNAARDDVLNKLRIDNDIQTFIDSLIFQSSEKLPEACPDIYGDVALFSDTAGLEEKFKIALANALVCDGVILNESAVTLQKDGSFKLSISKEFTYSAHCVCFDKNEHYAAVHDIYAAFNNCFAVLGGNYFQTQAGAISFSAKLDKENLIKAYALLRVLPFFVEARKLHPEMTAKANPLQLAELMVFGDFDSKYGPNPTLSEVKFFFANCYRQGFTKQDEVLITQFSTVNKEFKKETEKALTPERKVEAAKDVSKVKEIYIKDVIVKEKTSTKQAAAILAVNKTLKESADTSGFWKILCNIAVKIFAPFATSHAIIVSKISAPGKQAFAHAADFFKEADKKTQRQGSEGTEEEPSSPRLVAAVPG